MSTLNSRRQVNIRTSCRPSNELSKEDETDWFRVYGCQLGPQCPDRYHVHIQGVTGLDVGYINLLGDLNSGYRLKVKLVLIILMYRVS